MNPIIQSPIIDSTTIDTVPPTSRYRSHFVNNLRMSRPVVNPAFRTIPPWHRPPREEPEIKPDFISTRKALLGFAVILVCSLLALGYVYVSFPELEPDEKQFIKIPWDLEDAKNLGKVLARYKEKYYFEVFSGVFVTYIFLQTFAIPGSLFLTILSGFLFPFFYALCLVCTCSALGAALCFTLSQLFGKRIIYAYFPERTKSFAQQINKHKDNLLNYMLFLRITPFVPNWVINISAPVVGVPMYPFVMGTFLGVAPPSFVYIQAGQTLFTMTSSSGTFSWWSVLWIGVFAVLSIIPALFRNTFKKKFD